MHNTQKEFTSFKEFWPYYLSQHQNSVNRKLHVLGTILGALSFIVFFVMTHSLLSLVLSLFIGYSFAWTGHYVFEKNRPATFRWPFYSFCGDFKMLLWILLKKL